MYGKVYEEKEANVPASEAWKFCRTLEFAKVVVESLPDVINKVTASQGDGGPGTILEVVLAPGTGPFTSYKEKITVLDDEKRVKAAEMVEGGYLDLGFTSYRLQLEIIEKEGKKNQCIIRFTVEYELKEEASANASYVSMKFLVASMEVAAKELDADHLVRSYPQ